MIKIIGDNDFSSFTNLKKELKVSTGTIYHHLETLSKLIEQRDDKKYYLTELGLYAYNSLKDNIETIIAPDFSNREFNSPILKTLFRLTPKRLITATNNQKLYKVISSIIILTIGAIICSLNRQFPLFLFFGESLEIFEPGSQFIYGIFYIINFFVYFLLIEGSCRLFYKKKENSPIFFLSFAIILFPMIIYLITHFIFLSLGYFNYSIVGIIDNIAMILLQVWSLWLLTFNLIVNKHLKIENALIISLLLHYGGFSIILLLAI